MVKKESVTNAFNYFLHMLCNFFLCFDTFPQFCVRQSCFAAYMLLAINLGLQCCHNVKQSITDNLQ